MNRWVIRQDGTYRIVDKETGRTIYTRLLKRGDEIDLEQNVPLKADSWITSNWELFDKQTEIQSKLQRAEEACDRAWEVNR